MSKKKSTKPAATVPKSAPLERVKPHDSFYETVRTFTQNKLNPDSGYYAGRGVNRGDLSEDHLCRLHQGISKTYGPEYALRFAEFVDALTDMSASAFLVAFEGFHSSGFTLQKYPQSPSDGYVPTSRDPDTIMVQGMASIFNAIGSNRSPEVENMMGNGIKIDFFRSIGYRGYTSRGLARSGYLYRGRDCFDQGG